MKITGINFTRFFDDGELRAFVDLTFDGMMAHDVKVIVKPGGEAFLQFPQREKQGKMQDIVHPKSHKDRVIITHQVLEALRSGTGQDLISEELRRQFEEFTKQEDENNRDDRESED